MGMVRNHTTNGMVLMKVKRLSKSSATLLEIGALTQTIVEKQRLYNLQLQLKTPELKDFNWPTFKHMRPEIKAEQLNWTVSAVLSSAVEFNTAERHWYAVINRVANGWVPGSKRDDLRKIDPYLKPLNKCDDWFVEWCVERDAIATKEIEDFLWRHQVVETVDWGQTINC